MRVLFFVFPFLLFGAINGDGDYQIWERVFVEKGVTKEWSFLLTEEARWGDNATTFYYTYLQGQFCYTPVSWFEAAPGYRQIYKRHPLASSHFRPEYSPMIDLFFRGKVGKWFLMDRSRIQYLIFKSEPSHWLYRNLIHITLPFSFFGISPYFENEIFLRQYEGFNEDRVIGGLSAQCTSFLITDIFYIARYLKTSAGWVYNNVFGLNARFSF